MNLSSVKKLAKQRLRGIMLIFGLLCAYLCFTFLSGYLPTGTNPSSDDAFRKFTLSLFQEETASSTLNLHFTLQTPTDYGILNAPVTFGTYNTDSVTTMASIENCRKSLESFPYHSLSDENKLTYDVLASYLNTAKDGADFLLYEEPLSPLTGIQAQLPVLLAEYQFYDVEDVDTYLNLLETTPQYFASLIDLEREKSEKGLFLSDQIVDTVLEQCQSLLDMGENNYMYSTFEQRISDMEEIPAKQKADYIKKNQQIVQNSFLPAYQSLVSALTELKGTGAELSGVCNLHNGKKYYEYVVSRETGSSRSVPELKKLIQKQIKNDVAAMGQFLEVSTLSKLSFDENRPDKLLAQLESKIAKTFPTPANVNTDVKYVPKTMEPYLSPAFYLIPCIDHSSENTIYINRAHNMEDLNLFTTLAHEGYPGHLYQTTYFAQKEPDPIRSILSFGGYTEGWATYAEMCSYYLTPLSKKEATLAQKNSSLILGLYALADIGIHYDGWSLPDTVQFFSAYGIDDTNTISEIYELIVSDPGNYLKYYIGYVEMLELKKEVMKKTGDDFSQKKFHKAVLDVGPAPFDVVREYVLKSYEK